MRVALLAVGLLAEIAFGTSSIFTDQCMHATGRLTCPGHATRAAHVFMKLKDIDDGPNGDDIMDTGYSTEQGEFHLYGCARDAYGVIDATMDVKHNCTGRPQKLIVTVPKQFVGYTYNVSIDLSNVPTNAIFKTEAYTGQLQPMCDELHHHTHTTDRRRRDADHEHHQHAAGHTHEPGHTHAGHTHAPGEQHRFRRERVQPAGSSGYNVQPTGRRTHVEHSWSGSGYGLRNRNQQCVHAYGKLTCRPQKNDAKQVWISLQDEDKREGAATDEVMDTGYSTDNGNFHLFGCASDTTGNIEPQLIIKHKCGGGAHLLTVKIPVNKIGGVFNETVDLQAPTMQYTVANFDERMPNMCDDLHFFGGQQ